MSTSRHLGVVALAFAAITAACGSSDGTSGPSFADSVSTADAIDMGNSAADYAGYVADAMNFGGPSIALAAPMVVARLTKSLRPMAPAFAGKSLPQPDLSLLDWRTALQRTRGPQAVAEEGCTYSGHGTYDLGGGEPVDLNGNGIPDDLLIEVTCVVSDSVAVDTVVTQTQHERITVKEISGSLYGEAVTYVVSMDIHDNHGRYQFEHYDIEGSLDIRSGSVSDKASYKIRAETNLSGDVEFEEAGQSFNNSFDPTGTITLGDDLPNGALTLNGKQYYANSDDENLSFTVSTPTELAYSAACALANTDPPFTAGVLFGKLNNNAHQASFEVTFTSCGNFTVAVDGAYDAI